MLNLSPPTSNLVHQLLVVVSKSGEAPQCVGYVLWRVPCAVVKKVHGDGRQVGRSWTVAQAGEAPGQV